MNIEQIKKAKEGDVDEIGRIILDNMQAMYRVAFSILKNEDEIYDAISNTTIIVFEKISSLRKEEFFKTWLTRILINECYKIYNQNKKIIYLENCNSETIENLSFTDKDRLGEIDTKNLIQTLGKDLKETVTLYYLENFSVKEISGILEIPEGTVKSRLSRARKELEKILVKNEETERRDLNG